MGYVTFEQFGQVHKAPSLTEPVFEDNTWEQIIKACQTNTVPDTWEVGDQKAMTIGEEEHMITIIGKSHDTYSSGANVGTKAPLTFQLVDSLATKYPMHSSRTNLYTESDMFNTTLDSLATLMPEIVYDSTAPVWKQTAEGGTEDPSNITENGESVFLLSETEVFGTISNSYSGEGTQYAYYAAGNSKVKKVNGTATNWWLRSPDKETSTRYCRVSSSGSVGDYYANTEYGISYAFCF